jgi:SAM-dependent methyltransferase
VVVRDRAGLWSGDRAGCGPIERCGATTLAALDDFWEQLWEDAPDSLPAFDVELREAFLRAHLRGGERVLDLGCGEGDFAAAAASAGADEVLGVDVAAAAVRRARARHPELRFEQVTAGEPLPAGDATMDLVWCSEVLEHVVGTARLLSEARRVLRTGGTLLVTTPAHGRTRRVALAVAGWERHFDPRGADVRFYTARALREVLADFGFDAVRVRAAGGPPLARRHLLGSGRRAGLGPG